MTLPELLSAVRERGIELKAQGDRLSCKAPPGALTPELSAALRAQKTELLALLSGGQDAHAKAAEPIPLQPQRERYPLSFTQRRSAIAAREGAGLPTAFRLMGPLQLDALRQTLQRIVDRHATLRSRFHLDGAEPEQVVLPHVAVELPVVDLGALADADRAARLAAILEEQRTLRFDVAQGPLVRFHLSRLSEHEHVLFCAFSSLCFDGWSFDVFWRELREGYAALARGEAWPLPTLEVEYCDFVAWQRESLASRDALLGAFWRKTLGVELPPPALPSVASHGASSPTADQFSLNVPPDTEAALRNYARSAQLTPQMVMLAALYAFLARLGDTQDIVIASPVDARVHPSTERLIGPVVNLLLLRKQVPLESPFGEFVLQVRDLCLSAYDHQDYPIERLQVRSRRDSTGAAPPVFQVEFSFQQVSHRGSHMGALSLSQLELQSGATTNGLTLWAKDWGDRIALAVEYRSDLYPETIARHWATCYLNLLHGFVRQPAARLADVDMLGAEKDLVERTLAVAQRELPDWVRHATNTEAPHGEAQVRVVDEKGALRPLGAPGWLEVHAPGQVPRRTERAVLLRNGSLEKWEGGQASTVSEARRPPRELPKTDMESQMVALFSELLGIEEVGVSDDFFALGGNSLLAVRLFDQLQGRYGVRLAATTILQAGTPRALCQRITARFSSQDSCLVELKAGSAERCLFLVHDADGEVLQYLHLARRMPADVAVYGMVPLSRGRLPIVHTSIEEMAAHYVSELRARQPVGPYFLGGLCAGGLISFEIARQLEEQGEDVQLLALFDAAPPHARKRQSVSAQRWERWRSGLARKQPLATTLEQTLQKAGNVLRFETSRLRHEYQTRLLWHLLRRVHRGGKDWPNALPVLSVREVFATAEARYVPRPISRSRTLLVRATHGTGDDMAYRDLLQDELFDWGPSVPGSLEVVDVPGGHATMFREPHVAQLAAAVHTAFPRPVRAEVRPRVERPAEELALP